MRSYSSGFRPWAATRSGVIAAGAFMPRPAAPRTARARRCRPAAVRSGLPGGASCRARCALVEDAGDVVERAVGVARSPVDVAEGDAVLALEARQGVVVAAVVAVAVGDRRADDLALGVAAGEERVGRSRRGDAPRGRRSAGWRCASARRAGGPPRRGSGSRCRCRGRARRPRRARRSPASPGRARRWRRSGDSRRRRSRRGARSGRRRAARSRCTRPSPAARRSIAVSAAIMSRSRLEPGKTTTADFMGSSCGGQIQPQAAAAPRSGGQNRQSSPGGRRGGVRPPRSILVPAAVGNAMRSGLQASICSMAALSPACGAGTSGECRRHLAVRIGHIAELHRQPPVPAGDLLRLEVLDEV